jgi:hypothetical protein
MGLAPSSVTSFFPAMAENVASLSVLTDDSADGGLALWLSGLAGVAAALAVALLLMVYFRSYRSARDIVRHGLAAAAVSGLLAFVAYDMRQVALSYFGLDAPKSGVENSAPLADARAAPRLG